MMCWHWSAACGEVRIGRIQVLEDRLTARIGEDVGRRQFGHVGAVLAQAVEQGDDQVDLALARRAGRSRPCRCPSTSRPRRAVRDPRGTTTTTGLDAVDA